MRRPLSVLLFAFFTTGICAAADRSVLVSDVNHRALGPEIAIGRAHVVPQAASAADATRRIRPNSGRLPAYIACSPATARIGTAPAMTS